MFEFCIYDVSALRVYFAYWKSLWSGVLSPGQRAYELGSYFESDLKLNLPWESPQGGKEEVRSVHSSDGSGVPILLHRDWPTLGIISQPGAGLPRWHSGKESSCQCKRCRDTGSIPGVRNIPEEGNGNLCYSCLGNPMDRRAWQATVYGVAKGQTQL